MNIENSFVGFNVLLFKAFAEAVSVLTDNPLFEGVFFIFGQLLREFHRHRAVENTVNAFKAPFRRSDLFPCGIALVKVFDHIALVAFGVPVKAVANLVRIAIAESSVEVFGSIPIHVAVFVIRIQRDLQREEKTPGDKIVIIGRRFRLSGIFAKLPFCFCCFKHSIETDTVFKRNKSSRVKKTAIVFIYDIFSERSKTDIVFEGFIIFISDNIIDPVPADILFVFSIRYIDKVVQLIGEDNNRLTVIHISHLHRSRQLFEV